MPLRSIKSIALKVKKAYIKRSRWHMLVCYGHFETTCYVLGLYLDKFKMYPHSVLMISQMAALHGGKGTLVGGGVGGAGQWLLLWSGTCHELAISGQEEMTCPVGSMQSSVRSLSQVPGEQVITSTPG